MSLTAEQIAKIAADAAAAAIAAALGGVVPAAPAPAQQSELPPDPADEAAAKASIEENERHHQEAEAVAAELLPMVMEPRHRVVFDWVAQSRGVSSATLIRQTLRSLVALETPNWREAQGKGGSSTKNANTMAALRGE